MPATSQIMFTNEFVSFDSGTEKRPRIPRPPNAVILYRSDFLKKQAVPPEVEKRQQHLSRIAGQCWNLLPDSEKAIWHSKAAVVRAEHRARYFRETGLVGKGTNRVSTRDKRRDSTINSGRSLGSIRRSRHRQTRPYQSPYCEGMFSALYDSELSSPVPQVCFPSSSLALESPLPTSASLSPLSLPQLLPLFPPHEPSDWKDSSRATLESSTIPRDEIGCLLRSSDSEALQWDLTVRSRDLDLEITPSEIGTSSPTLQQDNFAACGPSHAGREQFPRFRSDPVPLSQNPPILPRSDTSSFKVPFHELFLRTGK